MRLLSLSLSLLLFQLTHAQLNSSKLEWNVVSQEEKDLKECSFEKDADVVVIAHHCEAKCEVIDNVPYVAYSHHKRIKILKTSGKSAANVILRSYYVSNVGMGSKLDAHTINFDANGKQVVFELKDDNRFVEKENAYVSNLRFTFPEVKEGSILEYRYTTYVPGYSLKPWFFQDENPVYSSRLTVVVPQILQFNYLLSGRGKFDYENSVTEVLEFGDSNRDFYRTTWAINNLPSLKFEGFTTTLYDYFVRMTFQINKVPNEYGVMVAVNKSWEEVYENFYEEEGLGKQISSGSNTFAIKKAFNAQKVPDKPFDKVAAAYKFVQDAFSWDQYFSLYSAESLDKAFAKKEASSGQINMAFMALLKDMGVTTHPVLVSTRENGIVDTKYPSESQFDHILAYIKIDSVEFLADATDPYRPLGTLGEEHLARRGLLLTKTPKWIDIKPQKQTSTKVIDMVRENGGWTIKVTDKTSHWPSYELKKDLKGVDKEGVVKKRLKVEAIKDLEVKNLEKVGEELVIQCSTRNEDGEDDEETIYLEIPSFSDFKKNPFQSKERIYPVDMPYAFTNTEIFNIKVPEGYVVEALPESGIWKLLEGKASYQLTAKDVNNTVQIMSKVNVSETFFTPAQYKEVQDFFKKISEKCREVIVLKKK